MSFKAVEMRASLPIVMKYLKVPVQEEVLVKTIQDMATNFPNIGGLARYTGVEKEETGDQVSYIILEEFIGTPTVREHLENYGFLGEDEISVLVQRILIILRKL